MTRLLLLIALGFVSALYFPESRAAMREFAAPAIDPVLGFQSRAEMRHIATELKAHERENYGQLPEGRRFTSWMSQKFNEEDRTDAWGGPYHLVIERDSFAVVSFGVDGLPRTEDDIREARVLARPRRRR